MSEAHNLEKSVFRVRTGVGSGTAFALKGTSYLVTNHHVVDGYQAVSVALGDRVWRADVALIVPSKDLAFLKVANLPGDIGLEASPPEVKKQHRVSAMGYPMGMPFSITEGIVSSESQPLDGIKYIQTDTAVNPGNSGGPLIDSGGHVIGVITCKVPDAENMGYALPISWVHTELAELAKDPPARYSVKCESCNVRMNAAVEYCDSCGTQIEPELFEQLPLSPIGEFVEGALKKKGLDPVIARSGGNFWAFHSGSAKIRVFYNGNDHLIATSPMVNIPQQNIAPVLEFILSYNDPPYYMSLDNNQVYLAYRLHMSDVMDGRRTEKLQTQLTEFLTRADQMDNQLIKDFGCTPGHEFATEEQAQ